MYFMLPFTRPGIMHGMLTHMYQPAAAGAASVANVRICFLLCSDSSILLSQLSLQQKKSNRCAHFVAALLGVFSPGKEHPACVWKHTGVILDPFCHSPLLASFRFFIYLSADPSLERFRAIPSTRCAVVVAVCVVIIWQNTPPS